MLLVPCTNIAAQGFIFDDQGFFEEQFFENGECELGKFSATAFIATVRAEPNSRGTALFKTSVVFRLFVSVLKDIPSFLSSLFFSAFNFQEPFKVYGEANQNYYKIEYFGKTGYILKSQVNLTETQQVAMTKSSMNIYAGEAQTLAMKDGSDPTQYDWSSSDKGVAYYNPVTKQVVTGNVGTTTIIGVNGDKCAYCTVNVVRKWITEYENQKVGSFL